MYHMTYSEFLHFLFFLLQKHLYLLKQKVSKLKIFLSLFGNQGAVISLGMANFVVTLSLFAGYVKNRKEISSTPMLTSLIQKSDANTITKDIEKQLFSVKKIIENVAIKVAIADANAACPCITHQPQMPKALKKLRKYLYYFNSKTIFSSFIFIQYVIFVFYWSPQKNR